MRLETYLSTQPPAPGKNTRLSYSHEDSGGAQCVAAPPSEEPPSLDSIKRSFDLSSLPQDFSAATPRRVSAGIRRRAAPQRITMHGLLPAQRATTLTLGDHHASPFGECGAAQSSASANTRSVSSQSAIPSGRLGFTGQSSRGCRQSFICHSPEGTASPVSPAAFIAAIANGFVKLLILGLIRFYQSCLSPVMPSACRFHPSCSAYAFEAVEKWGVMKGGRLALGRLLRCRPWSGSFGYDPVPERQVTGYREQVTE